MQGATLRAFEPITEGKFESYAPSKRRAEEFALGSLMSSGPQTAESRVVSPQAISRQDASAVLNHR